MPIYVKSYSAKNIGDFQYRNSFKLAFPEYEFCYLDDGITPQNYNTVALGGGNVCYPEFYKEISKFKKKIAISVGVSKSSDIDGLRVFDKIIVRDYMSLDILKKNDIDASYAPDFSFMLSPSMENGKILLENLFTKYKPERYNKVVAIILNCNILHGQHPRDVRKELQCQDFLYKIANTVDSIAANFIFIPFGTQMLKEEDRIVNGIVASRCKWYKKNICVFDKLNWREALDILSVVNLTISNRLHSSIFSFLGNTPYLSISIDGKFNAFCDSIKENRCFDYENFDFNAFKNRINKELENEFYTRREFNKKKWEQRVILRQEIDKIVEIL